MSAGGPAGLPLDHFGRQVVEGADDVAGLRQDSSRRALRQAEVREEGASGGVDQDVARLDVPVHEPLLVERVEPGRDLRHDPEYARERERAPVEQVREAHSLHVARGEVRMPVLLPRIDNRDEVRMRQTPCDPALPCEAPPVRVVARELATQDLERDHRLVGLVQGLEDDAHSTLAEDFFEEVRAEAVAGCELRRGSPAEHGTRIKSISAMR